MRLIFNAAILEFLSVTYYMYHGKSNGLCGEFNAVIDHRFN